MRKKIKPGTSQMTGLWMSNWILFVTVMITAAGILVFSNSIGDQLYKDRAYSLDQTANKIVQVIDTVVDSQWDQLLYIAHDMMERRPENGGELLEAIASSDRKLAQPDAILLAFDDGGNYYAPDGTSGRWLYPDELMNDSEEYQLTVIEVDDDYREFMAYLYRLPSFSVMDNGRTVTHLALLRDMGSFEAALQISDLQDSSYVYMIDSNGTQIYHQKNQWELIAAFNVLTAVERWNFLHGVSENAIRAAVEHRKSLTVEAEKNGESYFISYQPLTVNNWGLFLFVPTEMLNGGARDVAFSLMIQVSAIAVLIILQTAVFLYMSAQKNIRKQQQAQESIQRAADEAQRANRAKSNFLSHMSHDIRTPINGIMGMALVARKNLDDRAQVEHCLERISASSDHLLSLVNDVLDMSRIEQNIVELHDEPFDPVQLLDDCAALIEGQLVNRNLTFEKDYGSLYHRRIMGDPLHLRQIYVNILSNTVKFTPDGGIITLHAVEKKATDTHVSLCVTVADTGIGMKPEFMAQLYDPFTQENGDTRTEYQGTGLGMAIVKRMLDRMGGVIKVDSVWGHGTTVTIEITHKIAQRAEEYSSAARQASDVSGMKILLVEDNDLNREIVQELLEDEGVECVCAVNGKEAVELFSASEPDSFDAVLMDIMMPVMDGLEASRAIRALPDRTDAVVIPIIALTANAYSEDVAKTRAAGMNEHLSKPLDVERLFDILGRYAKQQGKDRNL